MGIQNNKTAISPEFSVYLDLLRLGAATFVMLFHVMKEEIGPWQIRRLIPDHGHDFVIVFFVLSGYVIAAAADRKRSKGLREYVLDRMARVYSVAIPTLIFCALLGFLFQFFQGPFEPDWRSASAIDKPILTFLANIFFVAESWSLRMWVFLNPPYWSLCYEVMYYVGFGVFTFMSGRARWLGIVLVTLIAGPKVILLLPCWVLGVLAYELRDKWILKTPFAFAAAFILPPLFLAMLHYIGFGPVIRALSHDVLGNMQDALGDSRDFMVDYTTALIVAINLYAVRYLPLRWPISIKTFASVGASMSFTLYLMHFPLIKIATRVVGVGVDHTGTLYFIATVIGILLVCHVVSSFTEQRRPTLRAWLDNFIPKSRMVALSTENISTAERRDFGN